jgi:hypothetical protein
LLVRATVVEDWPPVIVTDDRMGKAAELLLANLIKVPPGGAGALMPIVAVTLSPPVTGVGAALNVVMVYGVSVSVVLTLLPP